MVKSDERSNISLLPTYHLTSLEGSYILRIAERKDRRELGPQHHEATYQLWKLIHDEIIKKPSENQTPLSFPGPLPFSIAVCKPHLQLTLLCRNISSAQIKAPQNYRELWEHHSLCLISVSILYIFLLLPGEWHSIIWDSFCRKSLIDWGERTNSFITWMQTSGTSACFPHPTLHP